MRKRLVVAGFTAVATALVFAACRDAGVTPPIEQSAPSASVLGLTTAAPITRDIPLANDVSWSFSVGSAGATSSNAAAGLTVTVPSGALSSQTTITVTALAGAPVAYRFEPHGIEFDRKVILTQKLQGTSAGSELAPLLQGAYFPTDEPVLQNGLALVSELLSGLLNPLTRSFSFGIQHFSGYIVVSGRDSGTE